MLGLLHKDSSRRVARVAADTPGRCPAFVPPHQTGRMRAVIATDGAEPVQFPSLAGLVRLQVTAPDRLQIRPSLVLAPDR